MSNMMKGFLTVGAWTLISRILGFVREILIARFLGAGALTDVFFVAFALPNMFRRLFAEGAFNMAFVPLYAKKLETDPEEADAFARDAVAMMVLVLTVFSVIGVIAMPLLVLSMASGFADDARFDLAVIYGRIAFPYILFISLGALISGVLNSNRKFFAAAAAPALLNVVFIAAMGLAAFAPETVQDWFATETLPEAVGWLVIGAVPVGGIVQLGFVALAAHRAGHHLWPRQRPRLTPDLKRLLIIAGPALLANGVFQINLLVGRQVASQGPEGAISWLSFADRLYQLPLGVVGIAIGIVLLPELARRVREANTEGQQTAYSRATEFALLLTIPATVAFLVVPIPLVSVLYERGAFTASDTTATALALMIYAVGLPAFVLQKVLQPLYYAREDTRTPLRFAIFGLITNAVVAVGLFPLIGWPAAALGTTLASWAMLALLWRGVRQMGSVGRVDDRTRSRAWRILLASALMGLVLWIALLTLGPLFEGSFRVSATIALVLLGVGSYGLFALVTGATSTADLRTALRRKK